MANVFETTGAKTELGSGLSDGVATISLSQQINFTLYVKLVLPIDGSVFWVNGALLTDSAIFNASQYGQIVVGKPFSAIPARVMQIAGSLHYSTEIRQLEDRTASVNQVLFTASQEIQDFNLISPNLMYVAKLDEIQFGFTRRSNFYKQADLFHYSGDALYSIMTTQLVESMTEFDLTDPVVSSSLPVWLTLNKFFPVYPSYLVGQNILPPYAVIDIDPNATIALQSAPLIAADSSHYQLVADTVKITMYGVRNSTAMEFHDYVNQYSLLTDNIGVMNMPVTRDEKLTQAEFGVIAMKKTITFQVSYYQQNILEVAQKLFTSVFISVTPTH